MPTRIPLSHDGLPADVTDRFAWRIRPDGPTTGPDAGAATGLGGRAARLPLAALAGFALTGVMIVIAVVLFARNPVLSTTEPVASGSTRTGAATPASLAAARAVTPSPTAAETPAAAAAPPAAMTAAAASSQSAAATTRIRLPGAGPKSTAATGTARDGTDAQASTCQNSPLAQYLVRHRMPLPC